ncbi:MAG: ornithine carbamoyltransferase [Anaerolineae bacterium]|nr:ornithine carbamoyltransferase [Anaerolineae bacterium]
MKRDLICLTDLTSEQVWEILDLATKLKQEWTETGNKPTLANKTLAMVFQKPSLRTRVSFEMAMNHLGGNAMYLSPNEIRLGERESVPDVARVLSRYVDGIMARVFSHDHILQLAEYSPVPVINGLSDYNHPCQALADMLTIREHKSAFPNLKLAWVGDGNNVLHSLLFAASKLGMDLTAAIPKGYEPLEDVVLQAQEIAKETGSSIEMTNDPVEAVRDADVIYTDTWASMGQEEERKKRLQEFPPYQVNAALVSRAKPDTIVMHCLPAHRGEEITDEVADGPHSVLFDEAENRMHAQKAVLALLMS